MVVYEVWRWGSSKPCARDEVLMRAIAKLHRARKRALEKEAPTHEPSQYLFEIRRSDGLPMTDDERAVIGRHS